MSVQTSYSQTHSAAYAGGLASSEPHNVLAGLNKESSADIPYGRAVVLASIPSALGPNDYTPAVLPVDANSVFVGIALFSHAHNPKNTSGVLAGDMFNIISKGVVYVEVEQAVQPGDAVYFRHTTASGTGTSIALGKFRKDADSSKALQLTNARWRGKAAAGGIAALEIGTP